MCYRTTQGDLRLPATAFSLPSHVCGGPNSHVIICFTGDVKSSLHMFSGLFGNDVAYWGVIIRGVQYYWNYIRVHFVASTNGAWDPLAPSLLALYNNFAIRASFLNQLKEKRTGVRCYSFVSREIAVSALRNKTASAQMDAISASHPRNVVKLRCSQTMNNSRHFQA